MGGTWDLFRYPGVRSDSDMYTLGYRFRPWRDAKAIADGPAILNYIRETAAEFGVDKEIRYGHRVRRASWSSEDALVDRGGRDRAEKTSSFHLQLPLPLHGLLRLRERVHAGVARRRAVRRADRAPAEVARGSRLRRQARGGDRQRRDRRHARPRDGRARGARHHAPALSRPTSSRGPPRTRSRTGSAASARARGLRAHALEERAAADVLL
jgi:hypothetical protein